MTGAAKPIVTFGEVLLRLSPPGTQRLFQSPELRAWWGGAEANVAANLANLGLAAQHVSVLPDNAVGDAALGALRGEGVDTQHIVRRGTRVGLYYLESGAGLRPLRVVYDRAHSAFSELDPALFEWPVILRDARWLHLSGVSAALGESVVACMETAMDAAVALGVPVSLDLNHRPALWTDRDPRPVMQPLAARASLLIANPGAIDIMLGVKTDGEIPEPPAALQATAERLHETYGFRRIALTQREVVSASTHGWQAHLWDASSNAMHFGGHYSVPLVDRVGGGDAFAAALLHQLLSDVPPEHAVRFAAAAGALKLTIPGDVNRVRAADIEQLLSTRA